MQLIKGGAQRARVSWAALASFVLVFFLAGCAQLPQSAGGAADNAEGSAARAHEANTNPAPLMDLKSIIRLIEAGQSDEALHALTTYLAQDPKNAVALSLRQQLTVNPEVFLGKPATRYTVQSGDTLGGIAAKFLGNPLKFVILGRYNQISRVKDLRVGQVLKLPAKLKADPNAEPVPEPAPTVPAPAEPIGGVSTPDTSPSVNTGAYSPAQMARVQKYHEAALVAYRKQDLDNAIALWNKALAIDPNYEPALGYRARAQELQRRLNQLGAH